MNTNIIAIHEKVKINKETKDAMHWLFGWQVLMFLGLLQPCFNLITKKPIPEDAIPYIIILFFMLLFVSLVLWSCIRPRDIFFYCIHYIYPDKKQRDREIEAFLEVNRLENLTFLYSPIFKTISFNTRHKWFREHVSDVKTVLKVCLERSLIHMNVLDMKFIYWTQIIPMAGSPDTMKTMLMASKISSREELYSLKVSVTKENITNFFKDYTDKDLTLFFTSSFCVKTYCNILMNSDKNVQHLNYLMQGKNHVFKPGMLKEGPSDLGVIKYIKNILELEESAYVMANCIYSRKK